MAELIKEEDEKESVLSRVLCLETEVQRLTDIVNKQAESFHYPYTYDLLADPGSVEMVSNEVKKEFSDFYIDLGGLCESVNAIVDSFSIKMLSESLFQHVLYKLLKKNNYQCKLEVSIGMMYEGDVMTSKRFDILVELPEQYVILELKYLKGPITNDAKCQVADYLTCFRNRRHKDSKAVHGGIVINFVKDSNPKCTEIAIVY